MAFNIRPLEKSTLIDYLNIADYEFRMNRSLYNYKKNNQGVLMKAGNDYGDQLIRSNISMMKTKFPRMFFSRLIKTL